MGWPVNRSRPVAWTTSSDARGSLLTSARSRILFQKINKKGYHPEAVALLLSLAPAPCPRSNIASSRLGPSSSRLCEELLSYPADSRHKSVISISLSSRPERSGVEGPCVSTTGSLHSGLSLCNLFLGHHTSCRSSGNTRLAMPPSCCACCPPQTPALWESLFRVVAHQPGKWPGPSTRF